MLSSILFTHTHSFARQARTIHTPHLRRYFDQKVDNLYKAKQQLQKKLSLPQMPENLFKKVFRKQPHIFIDKSKSNVRFENKVKKVQELAQKYQLAKVMQSVIYKNRYILFKMDGKQMQKISNAVEQDYGFTKEQVNTVFSNYYRTINPKLPEMLDSKIQLFHDYLQIPKQQSIQLLSKNPLLIPASLNMIRQTILLLLSESKALGPEILSKERIIRLLNQYPEVFILGRHQIKDLVDIYQDWGLDFKEVWQLILDNPVLLNNFPNEVMPLKRKLFRYFGFTKQMGRLMLRKYPLVLMSSISSLQAKLIFIKDRLKLPINEQTLNLLQYKFSQIRPRGQLLVRAKQTITLENIIDFLKMTDAQFAKRLDIKLQRLEEQKQRFKQTDEIDYRRRKVLKGSGVQEKIKGIIGGMRTTLAAGQFSA